MTATRRGKKKGSGLENWIEMRAKIDGVWLRHNTPPMQVLRRDQTNRQLVTCRLEGKGWLDYTAILSGGVQADFDAKDHQWDGKARRWRIGTRLRGHQGDTLARLDRMGHIAFVYLRRRWLTSAQDYVIPAQMLSGNPASILWDDLEDYVVPRGRTWVCAVALWPEYPAEGWPQQEEGP